MSNLSDMKKHEANELNLKIYEGLSSHYDCVEQRVLSSGQISIQVGIVSMHRPSGYVISLYLVVVDFCTLFFSWNFLAHLVMFAFKNLMRILL